MAQENAQLREMLARLRLERNVHQLRQSVEAKPSPPPPMAVGVGRGRGRGMIPPLSIPGPGVSFTVCSLDNVYIFWP